MDNFKVIWLGAVVCLFFRLPEAKAQASGQFPQKGTLSMQLFKKSVGASNTNEPSGNASLRLVNERGGNYKRLYIGDNVPLDSVSFNHTRNYPKGTKHKLSDFKGKFIILDFWTKYCTSCIAAFPHMERLQTEFKDDVQILLVTKNTEIELSNLFLKSPIVKETKLPMILGDSMLARELFPHGLVPYHVWLDRDGKVIATTFAQETNSENLKLLIAGQKTNLLVRNEIFDADFVKEVQDQKLSFLEIGHGFCLPNLRYYAQIPSKINDVVPPIRKLVTSNSSIIEVNTTLPPLKYYSLFMNYIPGDILWWSDIFIDSLGNGKGLRIFNRTVEQLYKLAYVDPGVIIEKIIPEGKAKLYYGEIADTTNLARYMVNNSFCYESVMPVYSYEGARKLLRQDLSRFLGMSAVLEERPMKCLIMTRLGTKEERNLWAQDQSLSSEYNVNMETKNGYVFKNIPVIAVYTKLKLANRLNEDYIIVDEMNFPGKTKYERKIDVLLHCDFKCNSNNVANIQRELARYGIGLIEEIRKMKVLVLRSTL